MIRQIVAAVVASIVSVGLFLMRTEHGSPSEVGEIVENPSMIAGVVMTAIIFSLVYIAIALPETRKKICDFFRG